VTPERPVSLKAAARAATRLALLESAQRLLLESPAADPVGALKPSQIARGAQPARTTGAFYHIWPTLQAFRDELLEFVLSADRIAVGTPTVDAAVQLAGCGDRSLAEIIRVAGNLNFDGLPDDPGLLLKHALWSRHRTEPRVRELLAGLYDGVREQMTPMYETVLATTGRRMRPPYTLDLLLVVLAALGEGLHLRSSVDPDAVPEFGADVDPDGQDRRWTTFAAVAHLVVLGMTEPTTPQPGTPQPGTPRPGTPRPGTPRPAGPDPG